MKPAIPNNKVVRLQAMKQTRRQFLYKTAASMAFASVAPTIYGARNSSTKISHQSKPWIELSRNSYLHNAALISRMAAGKPIVAVLKNNAYGLGEVEVAQVLNSSPHLFGMAVVKDESALAMRSGGTTKPILLMGDFDTHLARELIRQEVTLSVFSWESLKRIVECGRSTERPVKVALYIDTGLGRMGIPYLEAVKLAKEISSHSFLTITQTFSTLTIPKDFAEEQIKRFERVIQSLDQLVIPTGLKHLAPSYSLLDLPNSHQDAVRPGILLHGTFPLKEVQEAQKYSLQVPYRLKAPVIRVEKLRAGDTIGFSRFYKVVDDEWIATLPIGWADGYDSGAENGANVLLNEEVYPVVNVNASHTNVSLGKSTNIKVGDIATLIGPDRSEVTPEGFGRLVDGHNYLQIYYKESIPKYVYESF